VVYAVCLIHRDGARHNIDEFEGFANAVNEAIRLADETGKKFAERPSEMPSKVAIYNRGQEELLISIMRGGLLASKGPPKLRSI